MSNIENKIVERLKQFTSKAELASEILILEQKNAEFKDDLSRCRLDRKTLSDAYEETAIALDVEQSKVKDRDQRIAKLDARVAELKRDNESLKTLLGQRVSEVEQLEAQLAEAKADQAAMEGLNGIDDLQWKAIFSGLALLKIHSTRPESGQVIDETVERLTAIKALTYARRSRTQTRERTVRRDLRRVQKPCH